MRESIDDISTHIPSLRRFAFSLSRDWDRADDLVQDCVTRAIERIDRFENGTNLRAWLFTILRNIHLDGLRRGMRGPSFSGLAESPEADICTQPTQFSRMEFLEFSIVFDHLQSRHRQILLLVAVEGLDYAEIAQRLDISVGTVKSRISRARARLRALQTGVSRIEDVSPSEAMPDVG